MAALLFALAFLIASAAGMSVENDSADVVENYAYGNIGMENHDEMNAVTTDRKRLWPRGYVAYEVKPSGEPFMDDIKKAFAAFEKDTCVKFAPRTPQDGPVLIIEGPTSGFCHSSWGRAPGNSWLQIDQTCPAPGFHLYLIMKILGFVDEQLRPDRDDYVTINYENIQPGFESSFEKFPEKNVRVVTAYDTNAIMHTGETLFAAKPGLKTVVAKDGSPLKFPHEKTELSPLDIEKIKKAYKCKF